MIEQEIDAARRVYTTHVVGDVDGGELLDALPRFWRECPEVVAYDNLVDAMSYCGTIGDRDVQALATLWYEATGGKDLGRRTAIASPDRFADLWTRLLEFHFPTRRFGIFPTLEAAADWLRRGGEGEGPTAS